jgi:hypothetical protein
MSPDPVLLDASPVVDSAGVAEDAAHVRVSRLDALAA